MRWIVGDVHGCARELDALLREIRFDTSRDELWCLGDLVNKGPDSLETLRLWRSVRGRSLLGNHDACAILAHAGRRSRELPTLTRLFDAPDADELVSDLRALPVLMHLPARGTGPAAWIVHAGLHPSWTDLEGAAREMNAPPHDEDRLAREDVSFAIGVRCCSSTGEQHPGTGPPETCAPPFRPWDAYYRGPTLVVHGHWARRGFYRGRRTMGLDSGCVYGGPLTAWCQDEDRIVQVPART